MRIICQKDELFKGLNIVSRAVPVRTPLSTLDSILIDASKDQICLSATDTEIGIETVVKGRIEERGTVAINSRDILEYIRNLPSDEIILESDSKLVCSVRCVNYKPKYENIIGKTGEDFLSIPNMEREPDVELSELRLKEIINNTIFSVSDSENNRIMSGELFELNNNKIRVISMDGHRVSIIMTEVSKGNSDKRIIIPAKTLSEISKILNGSAEDKVSIHAENNFAVFKFSNTKVYTTLIHGEFFNVNQMLSKDYTTLIKVNRQNLLDTLIRTNVRVKETDKRPTIFNIQNGFMLVTMNSSTVHFEEDIEIEKQGADLKIGFNPKFIIEALRAIDDEEISMYFDGKISPLFIRDEGESYIYVVLPINIMNE